MKNNVLNKIEILFIQKGIDILTTNMNQVAHRLEIEIKNTNDQRITDLNATPDDQSKTKEDETRDAESEEYEYNMYEGSNKHKFSFKDESKLTSYQRYCRGLPVAGDWAMMKMLEKQGYKK